MTKKMHILDYFPQKLLFFLKNNLISLENLQKLDYIITGIEWGLYILQKLNFLFLCPYRMPSWISQIAISYANLCRQFQKLQILPNLLVYNTSCSVGGGGGGPGSQIFGLDCHPAR